MSDDILVSKAQIVERCIVRAREELAGSINFASDFTRQDAAILNIQRACEATIDMAFRIVRLKGLGAPSNSREAFDLLAGAGLIDAPLSAAMMKMVGFRNVAVHRYADLDLDLVQTVIREGLDDLAAFAALAIRL
ncbi:type VII toxin-antitoxin system HepT family RNase toxin [Brevundimonas aurifodinae]|uniref:DUF86 domain-containing protein n=2 Tax=Brevundimonas TaxID=41275 RepID=A0ABV1NMM8_9CAUL|nr:MAG: hypothetical protein B7Z42_05185 [Brevundimonas sp. 12-68-7]OYX33609.1 MAG: hypothetical protein B7Z01_08590 [Brevundimonas subvibrioides]